MNMAWLYILVGGMFETVWAVFMKLSDGFTDPLYTVLTIAFLFVSTYFLNRALKLGLPMGPSYAVWVGIGAIGAVIAGFVLFGDSLNILGYISLAVLIGGIIGMNLVTKPDEES